MKSICVYCSSSDAVDSSFMDLAYDLGVEIANNHFSLVYGGAKVGMMGVVANSTIKNGGQVFGVMPDLLIEKGLAFDSCTKIYSTPTMRERKAKMEDLSSAFIALPGGYGTLEELLEIITLKQLGYHNKPIVVLNYNGFFDPLLKMFESMLDLKFAKSNSSLIYYVTDSVSLAITYLKEYKEPNIDDKWF